MKRVVFAVITGLLFIGEIVLLKVYDVAAIGPMQTEIGFSHINQKVHDMTGVNMLWYNITDYIGYGAIAVCLIFAVAGLVQLIKRRSLIAVDNEILALGGLFAVTIGFYVLFEKFIINYRPIIMPGEEEPEASFPSSHTVLILVVMFAVIMIIDKYLPSGFAKLVKVLCFVTALVTVCGRLYCGVHWLTDIIGGILLSITLLLAFGAVIAGEDREDRPVKASVSDSGYKPKH